MDGPQHYREAERILAETGRDMDDWVQAQVHATLALVAAHVEAEALRGWDVAR